MTGQKNAAVSKRKKNAGQLFSNITPEVVLFCSISHLLQQGHRDDATDRALRVSQHAYMQYNSITSSVMLFLYNSATKTLY